MKELLKNGRVINVFTGLIDTADVLLENGCIIGVDHYDEKDADLVRDVVVSNGGADSPDNIVALCPNCHRKIHKLNLTEDTDALKLKLKQYRSFE